MVMREIRLGLPLLVLLLGLAACADPNRETVSTTEVTTREAETANGIEGNSNKEDSTDWGNGYKTYPCGGIHARGWVRKLSSELLSWTPDGTHIVFSPFLESDAVLVAKHDISTSLWVVDANGSRLTKLVGGIAKVPEREAPFGFFADLSPDGTRLLYTTCEYPNTTAGGSLEELHPIESYNYEIAVIGLDGSGRQQLTENSHLDHYPVWSPDGSRIAFIADPAGIIWTHSSPDPMALYTMATDGSDVRQVAWPEQHGLAFAPPLWSPDGEYLAFLLLDIDGYSLNTVRADGTGGRTRLGRLTDLPTNRLPILPPVAFWSPNGDLLAFATIAETGDSGAVSTIYTARPDGTETTQLLDIPGNVSHVLWSATGKYVAMVSWVWNGRFDSFSSVYIANADGVLIGHVSLPRPWKPWHPPHASWSPTRPELLVTNTTSNQVFLVQLEGDSLRKVDLLTTLFHHPRQVREHVDVTAAWSPDGERIALRIWEYIDYRSDEDMPFQLYTMARDGTDIRELVTLDKDGNLVPANTKHPPLNIPGGSSGMPVKPDRGDVKFNKCVDMERTVYATLVHEAGHVLGIGGGNDGTGQERHHPRIKESTVIKGGFSRYKCSPTPFDIMAITALYQSIP